MTLATARSLPRSLLRGAASLAPRALLVRHGLRSVPRVALTFDDGPHELTRTYLDVLDELGIRATFFVVGDMCEARPGDVCEIAARGHELASHGHTHREFPGLSAYALLRELARTRAAMPENEGQRLLVRPPRGAVSVRSLLRCRAAGYTTVLWSLDSDDCRTTSSADVAARVARARPGEIVLLHEGQRWTADALPAIRAALLRASLEFVTVSELLGSG